MEDRDWDHQNARFSCWLLFKPTQHNALSRAGTRDMLVCFLPVQEVPFVLHCHRPTQD